MRLDTLMCLGFLSNSFGLNRIDRGIRDAAKINRQSLRSHQAMTRLQAQQNGILRQSQALHQQQVTLQQQGNQLAAQQLAVQIAQLETQRQQLEVQYAQLQAEYQREESAEVENQLLRHFVDCHEKIKQALYGHQFHDGLTLIVAADRVYAQLYNGLQDANNRMTLSSLRDKNIELLRGVVSEASASAQIAETCAAGLTPFKELIEAAEQSLSRIEELRSRAQHAAQISADVAQLERTGAELSGIVDQLTRERAGLEELAVRRHSFANDELLSEFMYAVVVGRNLDLMRPNAQFIDAIQASLGERVGRPPLQLLDQTYAFVPTLERHALSVEADVEKLTQAYKCQAIVRQLTDLLAWEQLADAALGEAEQETGELVAPSGTDEASVKASARIGALNARLAELRAAVDSTVGQNSFILGASFPEQLRTAMQAIHGATDEVVQWSLQVASSLKHIETRLGQLEQRVRAAVAAVDGWKKSCADSEEKAEQLIGILGSMLGAERTSAAEKAAADEANALGRKLVGLVQTKKGKEKSGRRRFFLALLAEHETVEVKASLLAGGPAVSV